MRLLWIFIGIFNFLLQGNECWTIPPNTAARGNSWGDPERCDTTRNRHHSPTELAPDTSPIRSFAGQETKLRTFSHIKQADTYDHIVTVALFLFTLFARTNCMHPLMWMLFLIGSASCFRNSFELYLDYYNSYSGGAIVTLPSDEFVITSFVKNARRPFHF